MHTSLRVLSTSVAVAAVVLVAHHVAAQLPPADVRKIGTEWLSNPYYKIPFECHDGWLMTDTTVLAVEPWAEMAGLRRGDRALTFNGRALSESSDWVTAFQGVKKAASFSMTVERGGKTVELRLPCRDHSQWIAAERRSLAAMASGDWKQCIEGSEQLEELFGREISGPYLRMQLCWGAWTHEDSSIARNVERQRWHQGIVYRWASAYIDESRFSAGLLTQMRSNVLEAINELDGKGQKLYADDLRLQLENATKRDATVPPSSKPAQPGVPAPDSEWERGGSGFAVSSTGRVVTALHVVEDSDRIDVQCGPNAAFKARIGARSAGNDLALLQPVSAVKLPDYFRFGDSRKVGVGQRVFTVGFPVTDVLGSAPKYTEGTVSALSGPQGDAAYFQVSVPIQPGNSGGPLLTEGGEVVGVVLATVSIPFFLEQTGAIPQNVNWAIKSTYVTALLGESPSTTVPVSREVAIKKALENVCVITARGRAKPAK